MSRAELYAIIDEVLQERYHPLASPGSKWIERDFDYAELCIDALANALWVKIVDHLEVAK